MNALVTFRGNGLGNLSIPREQKIAAMKEITSAFRAKLNALAKSTAQSGQTDGTKQADATKQAAPQQSTVAGLPGQELGRDAFLQLLVLELQNQDPLEPVNNSDMIAQLAQFSSLEQMESLNSSFDTLSGNVDQLNFISAQGLLGKYVEGVNDDGEVARGLVNSVYLDGSIVVLNVDGEIMPMSSVLSIMNEAPPEDVESETAK